MTLKAFMAAVVNKGVITEGFLGTATKQTVFS